MQSKDPSNGRSPRTTKTQHYKGSSDILGRFGISYSTLSSWYKEGRIEAIVTPGGKRLYSVESVENILSVKQRSGDTTRKSFIYARVSSAKQAPDLERQKTDLINAYPGYDLISDIGSGLNWNRKGFQRLLDLIFESKVGRVVVANVSFLYTLKQIFYFLEINFFSFSVLEG